MTYKNAMTEALEALDRIEENEDKEYWNQDYMQGNIDIIREALTAQDSVDMDALKRELFAEAELNDWQHDTEIDIIIRRVEYLNQRGLLRTCKKPLQVPDDSTVYKIDGHKFVQPVDAWQPINADNYPDFGKTCLFYGYAMRGLYKPVIGTIGSVFKNGDGSLSSIQLSDMAFTPTHWKPLPKPPQEDGE